MNNLQTHSRVTKTAAELITDINNEHGPINMTGYDLTEDLHLNSGNCKGTKIFFSDCTFKGFSIQNMEIPNGIHITDCKFSGITRISNVNKNVPNGNSNPVAISGCKFQFLLEILSSNFSCLEFTGRSELDSVLIQNVNITEGGVSFTNSACNAMFQLVRSIIKGNLNLQWVDFRSDFRISDAACAKIAIGRSTISGNTLIEDINCSEISISNSTIKNDFALFKGTINSGIKLKNSTFEGEFRSTRTRFVKDRSSEISFDGVNLKKACSIDYAVPDNDISESSEISFIASSFDKGIIIIGPYNTTNDKFILGKLRINCSYNLEGTISISNFQIREILVGGINYNSNINLEEINIGHLILKKFINYGNLQLISLTPLTQNDSGIEIFDSSLGKTGLINLNLRKFAFITISDSDLSSISSSSVTWFLPERLLADIESIANKEEREILYYQRRREAFRQLKYATEKQGNRIHALVFKAAEMDAFKSELVRTKPILSRDRMVLCLNQSNDHGLNWWKPVKYLVVCNFFLFYLIVISQSSVLSWLPSYKLQDIYNTVKELGSHFYIYFQLLNPTISIDKLLEHSPALAFLTYVLFFISRLLLAYFIYQTITAFRKFSK